MSNKLLNKMQKIKSTIQMVITALTLPVWFVVLVVIIAGAFRRHNITAG